MLQYRWVKYCNLEQYDEYITVSDIFSQLSQSGGIEFSPNISLLSYNAKPGAVLSPDSILPVPEVLYITKGTLRITTGEEQLVAEKDDVVYIPANKTRLFENHGDSELTFYSIIDLSFANFLSDNNNLNITEIKSEKTVPSQEFGNVSNNEFFTFYRLIHPSDGPYEVSYDIGTTRLTKGASIPEHYIDGSYQLFSVLSGSGNISVGCSPQQISEGDIVYVAPGALMNMTATDTLHMMVLTHPFYDAENDHFITGACATRLSP